MFDLPKEEPSIIKVIGVGGGGSNAVSHMYQQGIVGVDFAICNTDNQSLEHSVVPIKIQLGPALTEGRGAGSKPQVGKQACIESIDDVRSFIDPATKMLFVTAGMGGGTGTGAAPIIAKAAQDMGILTVGIVTLPFSFEGRKRVAQATVGLNELKANVDTIIIISNDKLRDIHGNLGISEAFREADDILGIAAKGIAEIITVPGYVNVDFEDVNTVMRSSGVAIMGIAQADGDDRARKAVEQALNSPLLEENDIRGAEHILINITSGTKEVTMDEVFEITEYVQGEAGHQTNLIWGNCTDETLGEKISITIIATGFASKDDDTTAPEKEKIIVSLDEDLEETHNEPIFETGLSDHDATQTIEFDFGSVQTDPEHSVHELTPAEPHIKPQVKSVEENNIPQAKPVKAPAFEDLGPANQTTGDVLPLSEIENVPAYLRQQVRLEDLPNRKETGMSRWTINAEGEPEIKKNNPFLHDNVD